MKRSPALRRAFRDQSGAAGAEFALILPIFLLFLFGIMDVGYYAWQINQAEKATQMGARMAVVTDVVAPGLASQSYVGAANGTGTLAQGDLIPASALGLITCTSAGCTCTTGPCPATPGFTTAAFNRVVTRMQAFEPRIQSANVRILYRGSGLGYAGDPGGIEIAPLTTVRLEGMQFSGFTALLFGQAVGLPSFAYSLTMEDGSGSVSN